MKDEPAFPLMSTEHGPILGLTKREWFAGLAMQGIWANPHDVPGKIERDFLGDAIAKVAVRQADALLAELERTKDSP